MQIRAGEFEYDDLIAMAEEKGEQVGKAFRESDLPVEPDRKRLVESLIEVRERFYGFNQ